MLACDAQIKTDNNPKALGVLTGFLHFLERIHSAVFATARGFLPVLPSS